MDIQQQTISRYKFIFPNDKLRDISKRTGINLTRIYRIMNGKLMKVSELEKFRIAINEMMKMNGEQEQILKSVEQAIIIHTPEELRKIITWIERKNSSKRYQDYVKKFEKNHKIA